MKKVEVVEVKYCDLCSPKERQERKVHTDCDWCKKDICVVHCESIDVAIHALPNGRYDGHLCLCTNCAKELYSLITELLKKKMDKLPDICKR